ncbi:2TM domain-containing protein [Flavobacterium sp. LAR06]|uniref:2TM domain-containing protein n=1 Tax=Flavobacterium sp. LAR06 TaxID=3064897 RepID=UPI0035C23356
METKYDEAERYYQAQKRVKEIREFYEHLTVFLICNPVVMVVNLMTSPGYLWFLWCVFGWGFAILMHGLKVFRVSPVFNKEWEDRKIREILEKENKTQTWE